MIGVIIAVHVIVCSLLVIIILIQAGRGGGLVDSFAGVESMFGTKTNAFLARATTVLSIIFFITCLSLALLSARQSRSLLKGLKAQEGKASQAAHETAQTAPQQGQPSQAQEAPVTPQ